MDSQLHNTAMLVQLNVSQWTARKLDRAATREVDQAHGAKDAGRYNKLLIAKEALEPMSKIEGAARSYHYEVTLAWGDNGERLLPAALFMDYMQSMSQFRSEFEKRVEAFAASYPTLVQDARTRLGTLYVASDYPPIESIRSRFSFSTPVSPLPDAADFRVNLSDEYVAHIKKDLTARHAQLQTEAVKQVWGRVREAVEKVSEVCGKDKPRIYDSMIENLERLVDVLPALNIAGDPVLDQIAQDMKQLCIKPDSLRVSSTARSRVLKQADDILARLPW